MAKRRKKLRLTKRDFQVLRDAHALGLVVPEFLAPYRFADRSPSAVKSTLRRLYGRPPQYLYLRPEPLDGRRVYYRLTSRGAALIGAPASAARRRGRQSLIGHYGLAWLICCHRPHERALLDPAALAQLLDATGRLPKSGFYIDSPPSQTSRLGLAVVDHGADVRRLVRKTAKLLLRLIRHRPTGPYLATGKFTLTLLTIDERKRLELAAGLRVRLRRQLAAPLWKLGVDARRGLPFQVDLFVVPGLDRLTFPAGDSHD